MGLLNFLRKTAPPLQRLPSGSFTLDRSGRLVSGTVTSSIPQTTVEHIGRQVLTTFHEAQAAQLPLSELIVHFGSLKIIAREMRGGAIVFLTPQNPIGQN